ncbi:MAG: hypothetical protein DMF57_08905 [Acidobacteria bacterium]|nr:MAG: hypothetical protein DMF57_08905 [Acidobacteriota bacterium]
MATKQKRKQPKPKPPAKRAAAKSQREAKPARVTQPSPKNSPPQRTPLSQRAASLIAAGTARLAHVAGLSRPLLSRIPSLPPLSSGLSRSSLPPSGGSQTDGGVRYLTVQDLIELHRAVSIEFGGTQAHPGVVESQFGLLNAVQRPQITTLGREAYPSFPDKVAAFLFALLTHSPFQGGNRRVALAALFAFCELNKRTIDSRVLDEKTAETLFKRASAHRELGIPPENVFREIREIMSRAIVSQQ